jgi:hypothetical protein
VILQNGEAVRPGRTGAAGFVDDAWWWDATAHLEPPADMLDEPEWLPPGDDHIAGHGRRSAPETQGSAATSDNDREEHGPDCECALVGDAGSTPPEDSTSDRLRRVLESWSDAAAPPNEQPPPADTWAVLPPTPAVYPPARLEPPVPVTAAEPTWFEHPALESGTGWFEDDRESRSTPIVAGRPARTSEPAPDAVVTAGEPEDDEPPIPGPTPWTLEGESLSRGKIRKGTLTIAGGILGEIIAVVVIAAVLGVIQLPALSTQTAAVAADTTETANGPSSFAALTAPAPAAAADGCWLAVMGTWEDEQGAEGGVARLGAFGLTAAAVPTALVPGETDGTHAAVVAVATEAQVSDAIARGERLGLSGVPVEAPSATCSRISTVPASAALGFADVPTDSPAHEAVIWATSYGLLEPCDAVTSDRFCPDATASLLDFDSVTDALGVDSVTNTTGLAAVLGVAPPPASLPSPPTRAELAVYVWEAAGSPELP